MESRIGWIAIALIVVATGLLPTMSARAQEPADRTGVIEASTPEPDEEAVEAEVATATEDGTVLFSTVGTLGGEEAAPAAQSAQQVHDGLVAISPGDGWQLPAPLAVDTSDWQFAEVGLAMMRVPADWIVHNRIGEPGAEDQTIGLSPPTNDLHVELRAIRNADSNYKQTLVDHAGPEYARSKDRLAEGVIFGFQPRIQGEAAGHVEVMNQFGKEIDDDGTRTWRLVLWRGRWEANGEFDRAEFTATLAQDRYEELAPLVNAILGTVATRSSESGASEGAAVE